jgi:hypothetical protein
MAEYIEKKKLVNSLKMRLMDLENDMDKGEYGELCENKGAREAVESCICEVEEQPTADVQPEIHAYWIRGKEFGFRTHNPMWYCSNCGGGIRYNTTLRTYEKHKKPVEEVNCFCRKCGAKMDLEPIYEREETNNG